MGEHTAIEWAHHTFNPWLGCTKVSPACDNCYAEALVDRRMHRAEWGAGKPRSRTSESSWKQPERWDRKAAADGERRRVFCASLADVFDNEVPVDWRRDVFALIRRTPHLDWLLLTKRPAVARRWWDTELCGVTLPNVWLGVTAEDQASADARVPILLEIPARVHFLSCEPLLSRMNLRLSTENIRAIRRPGPLSGAGIDWVIAGGESGPSARPSQAEWFTSLRDQCVGAGVAFYFKQWGEWSRAGRIGKRAAGRVLEGRTWDEVPA